MKITLNLKLTAIATLLFSSCPLILPVKASQFSETALDQTQVIAIARPYGDKKYDLLVIEQVPKKKQCWSESGSNPVLVNPLLLNYDFTGICRRSTDSNGYSVRLDGEDYGLEYLLRIVPRGNELVLIGTSRTGKAPEIILGSTQGLAAGFMKIILKPGWQFSKRTFNNKVLGHFYFSGKQAEVLSPSNVQPQVPVTLPTATPLPEPTTIPSPISPQTFPTPFVTPTPSISPQTFPTPAVTPTPSMPVVPKPTPSTVTPSSTGKPQTKPTTKPATINKFRTPN